MAKDVMATFNTNTDPASPATTCDNCVSGKYAAYFGQYLCTECADCVAGEERLNCGGSSPGECSKCVPGKYAKGFKKFSYNTFG